MSKIAELLKLAEQKKENKHQPELKSSSLIFERQSTNDNKSDEVGVSKSKESEVSVSKKEQVEASRSRCK